MHNNGASYSYIRLDENDTCILDILYNSSIMSEYNYFGVHVGKFLLRCPVVHHRAQFR